MGLFKSLIRILAGQKPPRASNELLAAVYFRKSCRHYAQKPVDPERIEEVLEAGIRAPSTVNLQTWSFFPFTNESWRNRFGSSIPFGAQAAIIVAADLKRLALVDTEYKKYPGFFYTLAVMNASLAAMNMAIAVEALGMKSIMLSQTGKTGLTDIAYLRDKLEMPDQVVPLTTLAFGYPADGLLFSPPKLKKNVVVHRDKYKLEKEDFAEWFDDMKAACEIAEREKLTEKFDKYMKLLPQAEKEIQDAMAEIKG